MESCPSRGNFPLLSTKERAAVAQLVEALRKVAGSIPDGVIGNFN
jgi:hypothetical protein